MQWIYQTWVQLATISTCHQIHAPRIPTREVIKMMKKSEIKWKKVTFWQSALMRLPRGCFSTFRAKLVIFTFRDDSVDIDDISSLRSVFVLANVAAHSILTPDLISLFHYSATFTPSAELELKSRSSFHLNISVWTRYVRNILLIIFFGLPLERYLSCLVELPSLT